MIVAYQPGGSIRDARVVLKHDEKIPARFNVAEAIVYREAEDDPRQWIIVKPKFSVLPGDSPLLAQPELPEIELFPSTPETGETVYDHADIIKIDESEEQ